MSRTYLFTHTTVQDYLCSLHNKLNRYKTVRGFSVFNIALLLAILVLVVLACTMRSTHLLHSIIIAIYRLS